MNGKNLEFLRISNSNPASWTPLQYLSSVQTNIFTLSLDFFSLSLPKKTGRERRKFRLEYFAFRMLISFLFLDSWKGKGESTYSGNQQADVMLVFLSFLVLSLPLFRGFPFTFHEKKLGTCFHSFLFFLSLFLWLHLRFLILGTTQSGILFISSYPGYFLFCKFLSLRLKFLVLFFSSKKGREREKKRETGTDGTIFRILLSFFLVLSVLPKKLHT